MRRGDLAKEQILNKIKEAFGGDFVAYQDKKIYVEALDGSEKVQIAIAMTCPKVPVERVEPVRVSAPKQAFDWGTGISQSAVPQPEPVEITDKEMENVRRLMKALNL